MRNCHFTLHDQVMKTCCVYCGVSLCCRNQANLRRCSTQTLRTLFSLKPSMLSRTWRSKNYVSTYAKSLCGRSEVSTLSVLYIRTFVLPFASLSSLLLCLFCHSLSPSTFPPFTLHTPPRPSHFPPSPLLSYHIFHPFHPSLIPFLPPPIPSLPSVPPLLSPSSLSLLPPPHSPACPLFPVSLSCR